MCVGDWRLGRLITRQVTAIDTSVNAVPGIGGNMQRVGVLWSLSNSQSLTSGLDVSINGVEGFVLQSSQPSILLSVQDHGNLVTLPMTAAKLTATQTKGCIIEYFLPQEYLEACLESFKSEYSKWLRSL